MGDKNPAIVLDDAENLDRVAAHVVNGALWNMGENCSAASRLIVQAGFKEDLPHDLQSEDYAGAGDDSAMIAMNRHAIGFKRAAVEVYAIVRTCFDPVGKVNGAVSEAAQAHKASFAAHLASLDEPCETLDAQTMFELTGSHHHRSGLYSPGTVMLQPEGNIRGLAAGLARDGVTIFEGSPATAFARASRDWTVSTLKGRVTTARVILTVNGHLASFGFARGPLMQ